MKTRLLGAMALTALAAFTFFSTAHAKNVVKYDQPVRPVDPNTYLPSRDVRAQDLPRALSATAAPETTWLASWSFDNGGCDVESWTAVDWTAQDGDFWHVDDFVGVGAQIHGLLYAPEGNQAMWCGARPDPLDETLCQYATLPGYGNSWDQRFGTVGCLNVTGDVDITFLSTWDSEPGYDGTCVEFDQCDDNWGPLTATSVTYYFTCIDGWDSDLLSATIADSLHSSQVRIRFHFTSDGAWSDADGLWNTDGAFVLDSLSVTDAGGAVLPTELFETESVGDHTTTSGNWTSEARPGYGIFSALFEGLYVAQDDPCQTNGSCLWGFFSGSTYDYACGGHPEQPVVPYGNSDDQYLRNAVVSPWVPITGTGENFELAFDVYRDMPQDALIFYNWYVDSRTGACPDGWRSRDGVGYYGTGKDWKRYHYAFGDLIDPGDAEVRCALRVADYCFIWCGALGTGGCHSHAPLFDNVEIVRIDSKGPVYSVRDLDLFQDNFSADGTTTGTVRADMANDILSINNPYIHPGDSAVVTVFDAQVGLAADAHTGFGSAVYAYVGVWPQGQPGKGGGSLTQDAFRYPVVDSLVHNGDKWYCLRTDTSFINGTLRSGPQPDRFCIDLNDNLFTPGDTVCYVFAATSDAPVSVTRYYSNLIGTTVTLADALDNAMEFTCLPTGNADILYVDDYDGLGAQPFFDTAFEMMGIADRVDRYDVSGAASTVGSGPGSRVVNVSQQILPLYRAIIWNSGDLDNGTIGDGDTGSSEEKSNDAGFLLGFLDGLTSPGGVYISGDNIAQEWPTLIGDAITLQNTYINHTLIDSDHMAAGHAISPHVWGEAGKCFDGESFYADGACPTLNDFDVLDAAGASSIEASYTSLGSGAGAVIGQKTTNPQTTQVGVILSGFSYHWIRDDEETGMPDRVTHLEQILAWFGLSLPVPTASTPGALYNLAQNYPNPFNPTTTVEFTVREKARVRLNVYNVAGQLVTTLVDDDREPGIVHRVEWDGRNAAGSRVASGVYFYRLTAGEYTKTRKMVLLK